MITPHKNRECCGFQLKSEFDPMWQVYHAHCRSCGRNFAYVFGEWLILWDDDEDAARVEEIEFGFQAVLR